MYNNCKSFHVLRLRQINFLRLSFNIFHVIGVKLYKYFFQRFGFSLKLV